MSDSKPSNLVHRALYDQTVETVQALKKSLQVGEELYVQRGAMINLLEEANAGLRRDVQRERQHKDRAVSKVAREAAESLTASAELAKKVQKELIERAEKAEREVGAFELQLRDANKLLLEIKRDGVTFWTRRKLLDHCRDLESSSEKANPPLSPDYGFGDVRKLGQIMALMEVLPKHPLYEELTRFAAAVAKVLEGESSEAYDYIKRYINSKNKEISDLENQLKSYQKGCLAESELSTENVRLVKQNDADFRRIYEMAQKLSNAETEITRLARQSADNFTKVQELTQSLNSVEAQNTQLVSKVKELEQRARGADNENERLVAKLTKEISSLQTANANLMTSKQWRSTVTPDGSILGRSVVTLEDPVMVGGPGGMGVAYTHRCYGCVNCSDVNCPLYPGRAKNAFGIKLSPEDLEIFFGISNIDGSPRMSIPPELDVLYDVEVRDDHDGGSVWYSVIDDGSEEFETTEESARKLAVEWSKERARLNGAARVTKITREVVEEFSHGITMAEMEAQVKTSNEVIAEVIAEERMKDV